MLLANTCVPLSLLFQLHMRSAAASDVHFLAC